MGLINKQDDHALILMTAKQLASSLVRNICDAHGVSEQDRQRWRLDSRVLHFHDASTAEIAWNDVQAIQKYNEVTGEDIPVPVLATEGYNTHGHTSQYDGGYIAGMGPHDHRDAANGGFAFCCYHPGVSLPQQPWAI